MTPERYEQVCQICYDALELEASQRADFLDRACADDESLRREVEAMLANEGQVESFLDAPALAVAAEHVVADFLEASAFSQNQIDTKPLVIAPSVMIDVRYLIEKELDRGGHSVVYLAYDQRLH